MVQKQRPVNMAHCHTVMVDNDNSLAFFVDFLALQQTYLIGIHHNQQCIGCDNLQRLVRRNEVPSASCVKEGFQERPRQRRIAVNGNNRRYAAHLTHPQSAHSRTYRIQVAHAMPHDDDTVALFDQVAQRMGNNTAAHMTALFHAMGDAAVKFKSIHGFHRSLVTAAPQRNINTFACHLVAFLQSLAAAAYTNGQRGQPAGMQRPNLVENLETFFQHPANVPFLHHSNIAAVGNPAKETCASADILLQQTVDCFQFLGLFTVLHIIEQFVVTVDYNNQTCWPAFGIFVQRLLVERIIHQIHNAGTTAALCRTGIGGKTAVADFQILSMGA